jgi:hypothetical protein
VRNGAAHGMPYALQGLTSIKCVRSLTSRRPPLLGVAGPPPFRGGGLSPRKSPHRRVILSHFIKGLNRSYPRD